MSESDDMTVHAQYVFVEIGRKDMAKFPAGRGIPILNASIEPSALDELWPLILMELLMDSMLVTYLIK